MKNYRSADSISHALILINQFLEKGQPRFTSADFYGCETEIEIENRYKKLLSKLLNGEDDRRNIA